MAHWNAAILSTLNTYNKSVSGKSIAVHSFELRTRAKYDDDENEKKKLNRGRFYKEKIVRHIATSKRNSFPLM